MKLVFTGIFLLISSISFAQSFEVSSLINQNSKGTVEGVVFDVEADSEPLAFATVSVKHTNISAETNFDGSYSFNLKPGEYTLEFSFIGYNTVKVTNIKVTSNNKVIYNQYLEALAISIENSISLTEK